MFSKATYKVNIGENDFPKIGDIGWAEKEGKDYSIIVREINELEWVNEGDRTALLVRVIVEINDSDIVKQQEEKKAKRKDLNKFRVIEGGSR